MLDSQKLISSQIEKTIPQFIRIEYPFFVQFVKYYYEWMEQQGAPYHFIANALNFSDVDRTSLEMLNIFGRNFLTKRLPKVIYEQNNIATLVKYIEQYYSGKGSEKSFEFLFRLFEYKEDNTRNNEIYYPSYDMLRVSDGKWINFKSIKIIGPETPSAGDTDYERYVKENVLAQWKIDVENTKSGLLIGKTTNTKNVVDYSITYESESGLNVAEIFLLDYDVIHTSEKLTKEDFTITTINDDKFDGSIENILYDIDLNVPGKYYVDNTRINIDSSGIGEDASAIIDTTSKGKIDSITIVEGGLDYSVNNKILIESDGFGANAQAIVSEVDINGSITKVKVISQGANYDKMPSAIIQSINGNGAILMIESDSIGNVLSIEQTDFGINYISTDTTITINTNIRIYNIVGDFLIGEHINSGINEGIIEYFDRIGNIMSIKMINGIFNGNDTITGTINNSTAIIYDISLAEGSTVDGILGKYNGKYINTDGHISSNKYIQDSYFYQMFSYMIKSREPKENWSGYIKDIHPAGTIVMSYEDIDINYIREFQSIDFISPRIDTTEFYKFVWLGENYHGGHINQLRNNTQIKQYGDCVIDYVSNINNNEWNKTILTFGSEITME